MQKKPADTVVSDKGTQLAPLRGRFNLQTIHGTSYISHDILSLPRALHQMDRVPPPAQCVVSGDPNSAEHLSAGPRLTVIDHAAAVTHGNPKLSKRRPKNSTRSNNSSFLTRGVVSEGFAKRFKDELSNCLIVSDFERTLVLLDFGTGGTKIEPLAKLYFAKGYPLCHSFNHLTAGPQQLDVVAGMSTGDLVWFDMAAQRYERVNKQISSKSPILAVEWLPNSDNLVAACHADGLLVVYDVYTDEPDRTAHYIGKHATKISFISDVQAVLAFKSDYMKIIDVATGQISEYVPSLFGGVLCCAVSPDGVYWASGGEDDTVAIFETKTRRLVANLVGHSAWVRNIAWESSVDPNAHVYRLVTIGEDRKVITWDFSLAAMTPAKHGLIHLSVDERAVAETHRVSTARGKAIVYGRPLATQTPKIFPLATTKPQVPEFGDLILSSLALTPVGLVVACKGGRYITWYRK